MRAVGSVVLAVLFAAAFVAIPVTAQDTLPRIIKGGIVNGKAISLPAPVYPADAKAERVEGAVYVDVEIDENGMVTSAVALSEPRKIKHKSDGELIESEVRPADPRLREAAEQAARQARFAPTFLSGQPIRVHGILVYSFVAVESDSVSLDAPDGGALKSEAINLPNAGYPAAARAVRAQGIVKVQVTVNESGDVISADAISGHPLLRAAAMTAARTAKFAARSDKAVAVLTYNFVLPKEN